MIDMKLTHEQSQAPTLLGEAPTENNGPAYPEGLVLELDNEALRKLAMGLPQVGDTFLLRALVSVTEVCNEPKQIEDEKCVEMQITAMELGPPAEPNEQQRAAKQIAGMYDTTTG